MRGRNAEKTNELDVSQIAKLDEELAETTMVPSGYRFRPHGNPRWEKIADPEDSVSSEVPESTKSGE